MSAGVRIRRDGTIDSSVVVAEGVRLDAMETGPGTGEWSLFYRGKPDSLIAAEICTDDMLIMPTGNVRKLRGTDALGRPFDGWWNFSYRRGAARAVQSVDVAWRDLPLMTAMTFPGGPAAIDAKNERERILREREQARTVAAADLAPGAARPRPALRLVAVNGARCPEPEPGAQCHVDAPERPQDAALWVGMVGELVALYNLLPGARQASLRRRMHQLVLEARAGS
ncbi:MAG TPA: hypothetical protein VFA39_06395 [Steroidobacteraceae bacterium]|nr:hypothetical protein [Steroidobacteraceae bacterium]